MSYQENIPYMYSTFNFLYLSNISNIFLRRLAALQKRRELRAAGIE